jgi:hypothetical protein
VVWFVLSSHDPNKDYCYQNIFFLITNVSNNTTGATSRVGTAYPVGALGTTPDFCGVSVAQSLVFCVVFCISLFVFSEEHCISNDGSFIE